MLAKNGFGRLFMYRIAGILGEENILANLGLPDVIVCMFIISIKTNNELEHYSANPQLVT